MVDGSVESAVDAVVFDYGGVLSNPVREMTKAWLAAEGIDVDSYRALARDWLSPEAVGGNPVHLLETGRITVAEFERAFAQRLRTTAGGPVVAANLLGRMVGGLQPDPAMWKLRRELHAAGIRVALLSNSWGLLYPDGFDECCETVVISGEVGLRKPDPRIYELVLDRLRVPASRVAFVDDLPINVAAAAELGMRALRHTDADTTRSAIRALVPTLLEQA